MARAAIGATAAIALGAPGGGCTQGFFVAQIAATPNHGRMIEMTEEADRAACESLGADHFLRVEVGPPDASMGIWVFDPPDPPRATIFVLHGVADGPFWMRDKARGLAAHGYRAMLVGLRGYGVSTGDYRGFGVLEQHDLSQAVDVLDSLGWIAGPIGVWGMSYGGAVAHMWAGHDPRVRAVVSVGAFSSLRRVVPQVMRLLFPISMIFTSDEQCQQMITRAGDVAGIDPNDACAEMAIRRSTAPSLIVHGDWDLIVPFEHAERLHAAANGHSRLLRLRATGHLGSYVDFGGQVQQASYEWFDQWLRPCADLPMRPGSGSGEPCGAAFATPPAPATPAP